MAINFCTLTNSTIDAFCGNRREIILDGLLEERYPPTQQALSGGARVVRDTWAIRNLELLRRPSDEDFAPWTFEVPIFKLTIDMLDGDVITQQFQDVTSTELAYITNLQISDGKDAVSVNITELEIKP
jgi:hypothetical protein